MIVRYDRGLRLTILIWAIFAILGFFIQDWLLGQISIYFCYAIFAMGLSLIWRQAGILSFGQAIFFGAGAYGYALITLGKIPELGTSIIVGILFAFFLLLAAIVSMLTFVGRGLSGAHFLCAAVVTETFITRSHFLGGYNGLFGVVALSWNDKFLGYRT